MTIIMTKLMGTIFETDPKKSGALQREQTCPPEERSTNWAQFLGTLCSGRHVTEVARQRGRMEVAARSNDHSRVAVINRRFHFPTIFNDPRGTVFTTAAFLGRTRRPFRSRILVCP